MNVVHCCAGELEFAVGAGPPRRPKLRGDCVVTESPFSFRMRGERNPGAERAGAAPVDRMFSEQHRSWSQSPGRSGLAWVSGISAWVKPADPQRERAIRMGSRRCAAALFRHNMLGGLRQEQVTAGGRAEAIEFAGVLGTDRIRPNRHAADWVAPSYAR